MIQFAAADSCFATSAKHDQPTAGNATSASLITLPNNRKLRHRMLVRLFSNFFLTGNNIPYMS